MEKKVRDKTNVDWIQEMFVDKYHDLNLTWNLSAENTGYHSANAVVSNRDIVSTLDNLEMDSTTEQPLATIHQMIQTNKILGYQLKQFHVTKEFLARQGQEDKKATNNNDSYLTKLDPTG